MPCFRSGLARSHNYISLCATSVAQSVARTLLYQYRMKNQTTPHGWDSTTTPAQTAAAGHNSGPRLPNYRIYDRTGGGCRHDIYAASLEDAIEQGRDWIEDGDWSGGDYDYDGNFRERTIKLDCCVREIAYVPDLRSIEALPGVCDVRVVTVDVDTDSMASLRAMLPGTEQGEPVIHEDYTDIMLVLTAEVPQMIDDRATDQGQSWDCSGTYTSSRE